MSQCPAGGPGFQNTPCPAVNFVDVELIQKKTQLCCTMFFQITKMLLNTVLNWHPLCSLYNYLDVSKMKTHKRRPKTLWSKTKTHQSKTFFPSGKEGKTVSATNLTVTLSQSIQRVSNYITQLNSNSIEI